jgi:hypothetical protein
MSCLNSTRKTISKKEQEYILNSVNLIVSDCLKKAAYDPKSKEAGHSLGGKFEEYITEQLAQKDSRFTLPIRKREMGDVYFDGIAINIKAGSNKKNGQPNMVSFSRLFTAWFSGKIDCYYIFMINVKGESKEKTEIDLYFFDFLDYLDYASYNPGPGQTMLNEKKLMDDWEKIKDRKPVSGETIKKYLIALNDKMHEFILLKQKQYIKRKQIAESGRLYG